HKLMNDLTAIVGDTHGFLNKINDTIKKTKIEVHPFFLDYIGYRVKDFDLYHAKKEDLKKLSKSSYERSVYGRYYSYFRLLEPIRHDGRIIKYLELEGPKEGIAQNTGLFRAAYTVNLPLKEFQKFYHDLKFDTTGLLKKIDQDIELRLDECALRFH